MNDSADLLKQSRSRHKELAEAANVIAEQAGALFSKVGSRFVSEQNNLRTQSWHVIGTRLAGYLNNFRNELKIIHPKIHSAIKASQEAFVKLVDMVSRQEGSSIEEAQETMRFVSHRMSVLIDSIEDYIRALSRYEEFDFGEDFQRSRIVTLEIVESFNNMIRTLQKDLEDAIVGIALKKNR